MAVVPKTQIDLNNSITGQSQPAPAEGILADRVAPPADVEYDNNSRFKDERWQFSNPDAAERVGKHLVEILPGVHSVLAPLLDRRTFLAYLQQDQKPLHQYVHVAHTATVKRTVTSFTPSGMALVKLEAVAKRCVNGSLMVSCPE